MLKTFIKHHIYEFCINFIFNTVFNNFYQPSLDGLIIGHRYKEIQFIRKNDWNDYNYLTIIYRNVVLEKIWHEDGLYRFYFGDSTATHINTKEIEFITDVPNEQFTKNYGGTGSGFQYRITEEYND
jgi:hypothetical protein